ncbi:Tetratricopeptide repeat superfamily protein [Perilla frutescens var. hirtella]|uniref:Tetratricopeptide repeat superfamily protein n=1 Tax=Perilla frutescens var. hirtella TaxID=608512 RepID=A0AAD4J3E7_PERFH|nr:Tetratricopeptide repeat superfamily protein [Perilla frutescens var. hirtella]
MANYGTTATHRPSTNPPPSQNDDESKGSSSKKPYTITFSFPFDLPSSPESAAVRIVRNLERFSLYLVTFIWTVLFIALVPDRKVSVVFLVATTEVAFLYFLLLRALPDSVILHKIVDKRFVFFLLFVVTAVEMILTDAAVHLFIVLAATVPVVVLIAALIKRDSAVDEEAGEMARLVEEKLGGGAAQPENLVYSYGTLDYEKRPPLKWNAIFKKISMLDNSELNVGTAASVLNQTENEGKRLTKWELSRVVKELRKFRRFKLALEVYDWINNRAERYRITTSDTAIQLDLIAKVHGISSAEQYFMKLPDGLKDKRIYGSLLNAYVRAKMREEAESLMDKIRTRGYASHSLPYNVMMTLYKNLKEYEKVDSVISEMKAKNISLDLYTYNIWLSSCGSEGSLDKMEQVFNSMQLDTSINPNWTTFSTMATMYIKFGHIEKAVDCLRKIESRITGQDRMPYHYLMSLYGSAGKIEDVYRVWNSYKTSFVNIPNVGYHTMISALVRMDDIEGAEEMYDEWLSIRTAYDPRVVNLLLSSYVRKGLFQKAETFFDQIIEAGGKPNSMTWEILSEVHIRNLRIPEALSCFQNAASTEGSKNWKPKPDNVSAILDISEQNGDVATKDALLEVLRQVGCLEDAVYALSLPSPGDLTITDSAHATEDRTGSHEDEDGDYVLLNQLQESL